MARRLILYAEDDADDRFVFEESFSHLKEQVSIILFNDGLELIKYLTRDHHVNPSLIVLDMNMPRLDGKDTLRILRDLPLYSNTPVVILTTSSLPVDAYFAKLFNAAFITKPMDEKQMDSIVKELLNYCEEKALSQP